MGLFVQKVGGSLLKSDTDFLPIAHYLKDIYQRKHALIVVISASYGKTNALMKQAAGFALDQGPAYELLLSLGEQASCALLGLALQSLHLPYKIFCGKDVGITQIGFEDFCIDKERYLSALGKSIVIVSGFHVVDIAKNLVNLGRGGSDLTAILLAHYLKADHCALLKDIPGVCNMDPNCSPVNQFFEKIHYKDLAQLLEQNIPVVQKRALAFAEKVRQNFLVSDLSGLGTFVGDFETKFRKL